MPPLPFQRALVVANPIAGRGRARARAEALAEGLAARGVQASLHFTQGRGDGARAIQAARDEIDLAVSVGGDGTLAEVLSALPTPVPVAVLPMGTANVLAQDLGLPRSVEGVLAAIDGGRLQALDTASVDERLSFLVTGIGIDGEIVRDVEARRRGPITKTFYLRSVLRTLWSHREPRLSVEVDGEPLQGTFGWVLVSNVVGYGGFMRLSPERVLDDGRYEVFLFPRGTRRALVRYGLAGVLRRLPGRCARMLRARVVRVRSEEPVAYEVDGDYGGTTPVEVAVRPERHRLIVP